MMRCTAWFCLLLLISTLWLSPSGMAADEAAGEASQNPEAPAFVVNVSRMRADDRGTDVTNVLVFEVRTGSGEPTTESYSVLFSLDGRLEERFRGEQLPFSFARNFKGQEPGRHEVVIELELQNDVRLFRQVMSIDVVGKD